jgi:BA14K-like protein
MKRLVALQTTIAGAVLAPCCLTLTLIGGAALAQTTGTVSPSPTPAEASAKEEVPRGGCMPIGLTVSGEIVFPIQCKDFIEQQRGKAVEQKPTTKEQKPTAQRSEGMGLEHSKPANKPVEAVPLAKHVGRERGVSPEDCSQRYRSYDAASGTYRGYDGQRRSCP